MKLKEIHSLFLERGCTRVFVKLLAPNDNSKNQIYLLECNPRLTASFAFYTQIELKNQLTPLFLIHLAQFIQLNSEINSNDIQDQINSANLVGSEITQKNQDSQTIKKYHDFIAFTQILEPITIPQDIVNLLHEKG